MNVKVGDKDRSEGDVPLLFPGWLVRPMYRGLIASYFVGRVASVESTYINISAGKNAQVHLISAHLRAIHDICAHFAKGSGP